MALVVAKLEASSVSDTIGLKELSSAGSSLWVPDCCDHWKSPTLISPLGRISFWKLIQPRLCQNMKENFWQAQGLHGGVCGPANST